MILTQIVFILKPFEGKADIDRDIITDCSMPFSQYSILNTQYFNT